MNPAETLSQATRTIPVRHGLSYADFSAEYLFPNLPVILADGLRDWPAFGKWTPGFFREQFSQRTLDINGRSFRLPDFIALVERSATGLVAPYFRNEQVRLVFPELLPDLMPPSPYTLPNWLRGPFYPSEGREAEIYIGGAGGQFPVLHYDGNSTHAFLGQVYGEKEAILYSPAETHLMYPKERPRNHSLITDVDHVDLENSRCLRGLWPIAASCSPAACSLSPAVGGTTPACSRPPSPSPTTSPTVRTGVRSRMRSVTRLAPRTPCWFPWCRPI